jgi:hypothetical protein
MGEKEMSNYEVVKIRGCTINPALSFDEAFVKAKFGKFEQFIWRGRKYCTETGNEVVTEIPDIIDTWEDVKMRKLDHD